MKTARPKWGQNEPSSSQYKRIPSDAQSTQGRKTSHLEKPPSRLRQLSSFTNTLASPFNALKARSFSRARQPSNETDKSSLLNCHTSSDYPAHGGQKASQTYMTPPDAGRSPWAAWRSCTNFSRPMRPTLPKSTTVSFLPLPLSQSSISPPKPPPALVQSHSTGSLYRSRIPTPVRGVGGTRQSSFSALTPVDTNLQRSLVPPPSKSSVLNATNSQKTGTASPSGVAKVTPLAGRSKTQPNLLSAMRSKYSVTGKENFRGAGARILETAYEEISPVEDTTPSPRRSEENSYSGSPSETGSIRIETASFAFSPRKMTPSMALERALSSYVRPEMSAGSITDRVPTPPTAKKIQIRAIRPPQPRLSSGHTITQYKLLQPIQPDSPPLSALSQQPASPDSPCDPETPKASDFNNFLARRNSPIKKQTPLRRSIESDRTSPDEQCEPSPTPGVPRPGFTTGRLTRQVNDFQPSSYWAGRFSSMQDRLLNESFSVDARPVAESDAYETCPSSYRSGSASSVSRTSETEQAHARAKRIFQLLEASCASTEALRSLRLFQNRYAHVYSILALRCEVPAVASKQVETLGAPASETDKEGSAGSAKLRKRSFVDRLLMGRRNARARLYEASEETVALIEKAAMR